MRRKLMIIGERPTVKPKYKWKSKNKFKMTNTAITQICESTKD